MPFINAKVSIPVSNEQEEILKSKFGKAISIIPGKSEIWLMVNIEDNCRMYFRGKGDIPTAFIEVKIFGNASSETYNKFTSEITEIVSDVLNIAPDSIYVAYQEIENWGYNGHNF